MEKQKSKFQKLVDKKKAIWKKRLLRALKKPDKK